MRTPQPPILVSVADAAEMLGISRASLYRLINGKQIPSLVLPGTRSRRIPVAGLKQWVDQNLVAGLLDPDSTQHELASS